MHCSKFCSLGEFPFTTALQECPRKGLQCCSYPFVELSAYHAEIGMIRSKPSFPLSNDFKKLHEATGVDWEEQVMCLE
jgi:hypothetical protein